MSVRSYFERTADDFDALYEDRQSWSYRFNRVFRRGLFQRIEKTLKAFEGLQDFTVLDLGCGSGRNSMVFVQAGARRVVGIDFSARMLDLARKNSRSKGIGEQCEFIQGDFLDYSFKETFDVVVALGVFDYVSDPVRVLAHMAELSCGRVVASFPRVSLVRAPLRKLRYALNDCPVYFYTSTRLRRICHEAQLSRFSIDPLASSGYMLVGQTAAAGEPLVSNA